MSTPRSQTVRKRKPAKAAPPPKVAPPDEAATPEKAATSRPASTDKLWKQYKEGKCLAAYKKLVCKLAPFVHYVAGRLAVHLPACVNYDDLVSYGIFGLIDAIERFDPSRNNRFETFAKSRIRGAILDELRLLDWVPRSVRQKTRKVEHARTLLQDSLGREPTKQEIASFMGLPIEDLQKILRDCYVSLVMSLDESAPGDEGYITRQDVTPDRRIESPDQVSENKELKRLLSKEITRLKEKERLVLTLYYFEGLTAKEIAAILGVSDSRISQIHTKALQKLNDRLRDTRTDLRG